MRGIGSTLSRLPAARAFLAGAAFLASTAVRPGMSQAAPMEASGPDETALAVPRVHLPGALPGGPSGVGLPQPLAPSEAARLRRIFALQRAGDMPAAIAATAELTDDTLLGHLLADRFIAAPARATAPELAAWLGRYADLPDAPTVYRLLLHAAPNTRPAAFLPAIPAPAAAEPSLPPRQPGLDAAVLAAARAGHADAALHLVARARIPSLYGAMLRGEVATALLEQGRDREALSTGRDGWQHADGALGQPAYVAALAAWRAGEPDAAGRLFQAASTAPLATPDARAAAAFWAARVRGRADDPAGSRAWLLRAAAAAPASFYGLLARAVLGLDRPATPPGATDHALHAEADQALPGEANQALPGQADQAPPGEADQALPGEADQALPGEADLDAIAALPAGRRAFALLQVGEPDRARAEFRLLWPQVEADPALRRALLLSLRAAALPDLAEQFASLLPGSPPPAADRPPALAPRGGFTIDPAMVYGLARVESNFDPAAVSGAGAHGLMQIMPLTAGFIAGDPARYTGRAARLHDPALNLQLGQKYVRYLADSTPIHGDLLRLLASYNAGPASTARWSVDDRGDPLLFIEAIPLDETRRFVQSVLAYTWIYAARMKLPSPTRAALAAGLWPQLDRGLLH